MVRLLARWTGDYGRATNVTLGLHVFLFLLGWYWFGRLILGPPAWAGAWTFLQLAWMPLNMGEFWGPWPDVLPRWTFQALLPYLLGAVLTVARCSPLSWPLLGALTGALVYVHSVSTIPWGFAVWSSLWFLPMHRAITWKQRAGWSVLYGGCCALAIAPFARLYLQEKQYGPATQHDLLLEAMRYRMGGDFLSTSEALIPSVANSRTLRHPATSGSSRVPAPVPAGR